MQDIQTDGGVISKRERQTDRDRKRLVDRKGERQTDGYIQRKRGVRGGLERERERDGE